MLPGCPSQRLAQESGSDAIDIGGECRSLVKCE